jgi:hypothetical protein
VPQPAVRTVTVVPLFHGTASLNVAPADPGTGHFDVERADAASRTLTRPCIGWDAAVRC